MPYTRIVHTRPLWRAMKLCNRRQESERCLCQWYSTSWSVVTKTLVYRTWSDKALITRQMNGGSVAMAKCKPCGLGKSLSQEFTKLFLFDTFPACVRKTWHQYCILSFISRLLPNFHSPSPSLSFFFLFLSLSFSLPLSAVFLVWWSPCVTHKSQNKTGKEADRATLMSDQI